jgi:MoaA/NifB/PqqE/SkfB family radical SAM enzyme
MRRLKDIRLIQIELTTRCNARCPMCMRNYRGLDYNSGYPETELTLQDIKHILTPSLLAQLISVVPDMPLFYGQQRGIYFNGNLGDFAMAHDALEIVRYITDHKVPVTINTNGSLRHSSWWQELAQINPELVSVGFALDGLEGTHELYRQDTNWRRIIHNAETYIQAGGYAIWRFIEFEHNRHQESQCRQLAKDFGFRQFEILQDGRTQGPVYTRTGEFSHWIGPPQDSPAPVKALLESHITWFDYRTVKTSRDRPDTVIDCHHQRNREIYIAADGSVYPCCYLGFYPTTMQQPGNQQIKELVWENNALEYDLEHCMQWFDRVEQSWNNPSIADGKLYTCVESCGRCQ